MVQSLTANQHSALPTATELLPAEKNDGWLAREKLLGSVCECRLGKSPFKI
jgi:hypothetical protein